MVTTLIVVLHLIVCIALIMIILLQSGKGADIGAVFGGGSSNTIFGSTGATPFLSKVTIAAAIIFMVTSIFLTYFSGKGVARERSIMSDQPTHEMPVAPPGSVPETGKGEVPGKGPETPPGDQPAAGAVPVTPVDKPAAPAATPTAPPTAPTPPAEKPAEGK